MRPFVAVLAELACLASFGVAEGLTENLIPGIRHHAEEGGRVPFRDRPILQVRIIGEAEDALRHTPRLDMGVDFEFDERGEPSLQEIKRLDRKSTRLNS